ncbi:MAG: hypothetical protein V1779_09890 [bacterium]
MAKLSFDDLYCFDQEFRKYLSGNNRIYTTNDVKYSEKFIENYKNCSEPISNFYDLFINYGVAEKTSEYLMLLSDLMLCVMEYFWINRDYNRLDYLILNILPVIDNKSAIYSEANIQIIKEQITKYAKSLMKKNKSIEIYNILKNLNQSALIIDKNINNIEGLKNIAD